MPSSFTRLDMSPSTSTAYDVYGNMLYPSEWILMESLLRVAVDGDGYGALVPEGHAKISAWGYLTRAWISQMVEYLGFKENIIDDSDDTRAIDWYSKRFGRIYVDKNGPMDCRVSKHLVSGREMKYDMTGTFIS